MGPSKRFYFYFNFFLWEKEKKKLHEEKPPWWRNEGEFLACPSQMNSVAHPLLQKQWSTSASQPLEKFILAANGQFHAAKSFFPSKRWKFLYSQWQHSSWLPCKWEWILGISFFFFVNHGFPNQIFHFVPTHQPCGWKRIFFPLFFSFGWFSFEAQ